MKSMAMKNILTMTRIRVFILKTDNLAWLNFNYEAETDSFFGSDTNTTKENEVRDDEMVTFENKTSNDYIV